MYQKQAEIKYFHYILRHKGRYRMDLGKSNPSHAPPKFNFKAKKPCGS